MRRLRESLRVDAVIFGDGVADLLAGRESVAAEAVAREVADLLSVARKMLVRE